MVLALAQADPAAATEDYPRLFGTRELFSDNLSLFPKWRGAIERYHQELEACAPELCDRDAWESLIDEFRALDGMARLAAVNRMLNQKPYIVDSVNWGESDYWATPFQFLRKSGDCEDYAFAKYMALRALGFSAEALRIVVLQDLNLRLPHAVLVVYVDGRAMVLDNQIEAVMPAESIRHYQPIYSVNEDGWWLHRP